MRSVTVESRIARLQLAALSRIDQPSRTAAVRCRCPLSVERALALNYGRRVIVVLALIERTWNARAVAKYATVDEYIEALPAFLRNVAERARKVIDANLTGAEAARPRPSDS